MSEEARQLITGNDAICQAAIYAGCRAYLGYPITPSSEIMEGMARDLPAAGGVFLQMEDEIGSMAAVVGASWAGVKPMTATSGPGFSLMQENLGLAIMLELPCVIVNVQRVGPSTGVPTVGAQQDTMQAIWGRHGDQTVIVVAPSTLQEMYDLTVHAFNLAETYRVPVVLLTDGELAHLRGEVVARKDLPVAEREALAGGLYRTPYRVDETLVPGFAPLGGGAVTLATGLAHDERGYPTENLETVEALVRRLDEKISGRGADLELYEAAGTEDADTVLVAYGAAAASARWAYRELRRQGHRAGYFVPKILNPFPAEALGRALERCSQVIVGEMSLGQLVHLVRQVVGRDVPCEVVSQIGGPLDPRRLVDAAMAYAAEGRAV